MSVLSTLTKPESQDAVVNHMLKKKNTASAFYNISVPLNVDVPSWNSRRILGIICVTRSIFDFRLRNTSALSPSAPSPSSYFGLREAMGSLLQW